MNIAIMRRPLEHRRRQYDCDRTDDIAEEVLEERITVVVTVAVL